MRPLSLAFLVLFASSGWTEEKPRFTFNRMIAHWAEWDGPDYLAFIDEAKPEVVQVGFYGAHFYSLAHTPFGKGYPAHFPVQGLKEMGDRQEQLNKEIHKRGGKVVGHFNVEFLVGDPEGPNGPTGFFKFYREMWDEKTLGKKPIANPLDLLEKDGEGKPRVSTNYSIGKMREHWGCLVNPHWKAVLKAWVKAGIDRGVDGFIANYFYRHDCLCEHCQKAYREHLGERYTPVGLKEHFGIDNLLKTHKFTEIGGWHNPKESSVARREALRFSQIATKKAFDEVFVQHGRSLKPDLIVGQWNHLGYFSQISGDERCMLPAKLWSKDEDYLWYSTGGAACYTDLQEGYLGEGTLQGRYIRGASGNKTYTLGKYESTRIRVAISELAANGGAPMGFYTRYKDPEARKEIVRYYDFLRKHDNLHKNSTPHAEATLLFPRTRVFEGDVEAVDSFRKIGKKLLDEHVLFDVLPDDAVAEGLKKPEAGRIVLDVKKEPTLAKEKHSRFEAPWTVRVSMNRPHRSDDLTLHLVNYNRTEPEKKKSPGSGIKDEKPIAVESVKADIVLPKGKRVAKVEAMTPEEPEAVALKYVEKDGRVTFEVPKFLVYSLTRIQLR